VFVSDYFLFFPFLAFKPGMLVFGGETIPSSPVNEIGALTWSGAPGSSSTWSLKNASLVWPRIFHNTVVFGAVHAFTLFGMTGTGTPPRMEAYHIEQGTVHNVTIFGQPINQRRILASVVRHGDIAIWFGGRDGNAFFSDVGTMEVRGGSLGLSPFEVQFANFAGAGAPRSGALAAFLTRANVFVAVGGVSSTTLVAKGISVLPANPWLWTSYPVSGGDPVPVFRASHVGVSNFFGSEALYIGPGRQSAGLPVVLNQSGFLVFEPGSPTTGAVTTTGIAASTGTTTGLAPSVTTDAGAVDASESSTDASTITTVVILIAVVAVVLLVAVAGALVVRRRNSSRSSSATSSSSAQTLSEESDSREDSTARASTGAYHNVDAVAEKAKGAGAYHNLPPSQQKKVDEGSYHNLPA
jgi:hypothetical protein